MLKSYNNSDLKSFANLLFTAQIYHHSAQSPPVLCSLNSTQKGNFLS